MRSPLHRLAAVLRWPRPVAAWLLGFAFALPGLFSAPPLDRDESRFAQASVQMLETGDFLRIRFQNEARNKKPAGAYWLQAASVAVVSKAADRSIWAHRLPSAIAAGFAALFTYLAGARLFDRRIGLLGAALFAASILASTEGMIAKTDALLGACVAGALAALAMLRTRGPERSGRWAAMGFWGAIGAGVLIKGPVAPMIAALGLFAALVWERRSAWAAPLLHPLGLMTVIAFVAPWTIAIGLATHGVFFSEAIGGDLGGKLAAGAEGHGAPPGLHLALLPLLSFPITLGLPAAGLLAYRTVRAPRNTEPDAGARFLLAWIVPAWLVFELTPTKLPHYPLPLYPALALLAGAGLQGLYERGGWRLKGLCSAGFLLAGAALTGVCAFAATQLFGDAEAGLRRAAQTGLALGLPLLGAAIFILFERRATLAVVAASAFCALLLTTARERIAPEARRLFVSDVAVAALQRAGLAPERNGGGLPLLSIGFSEPSLVFLTRTDTALRTGHAGALEAQIGQAALVEAREQADFETGLAQRGLMFQPLGAPVAGLNYSKGRDVSLQPGRITERAEATGAAPH